MRTYSVLALVAALAPGCLYDGSGVDPAETSPLLYRLGTRAVLDLEDSSHIDITATDDDGQRVPSMEADIVDGVAALRATPEGVIVVEALDIELSDVVVPAGLLSAGEYQVTDLRLRLGIQLATIPEWSADRRHAVGTGEADLLLEYALVVGGDVTPMGTRKIEATPFQIAVDLGEGDVVTARIATTIGGELSRFLDRIQLSNFSMRLDATSVPLVD
jgi:hypothetical protein